MPVSVELLLFFVSLFLSLVGGDPFLDFELISTAIIQLSVSLVAAVVLIFILAKYLPKTTIFNKFVLAIEEKKEAGFASHSTSVELVGREGVAITTLRPAGTAKIDGNRVDVVSDSEYIEKGQKIKVIAVEGIRVVVKEI